MIISKIDKSYASSVNFPKLMVNTNKHHSEGAFGMVLLMSSERCGTVLVSGRGDPWPVGHHSNTWVAEDLEDFGSAITIQNL